MLSRKVEKSKEKKSKMKTPEEMAEEWLMNKGVDMMPRPVTSAFLAGYNAAEEKYKAQIKELETQLENWQHNAVHGDEGL